MSEDPADNDKQSADVDDDSTDDSQLDDVLDRLESSLAEYSESAADEAESTAGDFESMADRSESTAGDFESTAGDTDPSRTSAPADVEPTASEPEPADSQPDAGRSDGNRLWDRFAGDRQSRERSPPPQSEPDITESVSDEPSFTPAGSDADQLVDQSVDTDSPVNTDQPADDRADTGSRTSFRGILDRISHRIGGTNSLFGSSSADPADSESSTATGDERSTATEATTAGDEPTAATHGQSSTDQYTATRQSQDSAPSASANSSQEQSVTIEQVLEQIDLFGRATASSQVLLLSPTAHSVTKDIYQRVLLPADGTGQNVLLVSALSSPTDQLSAVKRIPEWSHGSTGVIEVGQSVLKPSTPTQGPDPTVKLDVYKQLSNFQNLAKLGVNISHITSRWSTTQRPSVVGVHTLSSIQQYVGNETMFQFLFTLKGQLNSMGVRGFYHMDPAAHTENEISTINSAFDVVVTVDSDGSIDIE